MILMILCCAPVAWLLRELAPTEDFLLECMGKHHSVNDPGQHKVTVLAGQGQGLL